MKYFTPSIEDIRVGYECEIKSPHSEAPWGIHTVIDSTLGAMINFLKIGSLRTPYLTKEQIEAEGWNHFDTKNNHFKKENYVLVYKFSSKELQIADTNSSWGWQVKFVGECKDINTFRWLCKLIGL